MRLLNIVFRILLPSTGNHGMKERVRNLCLGLIIMYLVSLFFYDPFELLNMVANLFARFDDFVDTVIVPPVVDFLYLIGILNPVPVYE